MNHLSDAMMQAYLDGTAGITKQNMEAHLSVCEECRESMAIYRMMHHTIRQEEFILPAHFADIVAEKVGLVSTDESETSVLREWWWLLPVGASGIGISAYYVPSTMTGAPVERVLQENIRQTQTYFTIAEQMGGWIGSNFQYLIFGLFLLLLFDMIERKFLRLRVQH